MEGSGGAGAAQESESENEDLVVDPSFATGSEREEHRDRNLEWLVVAVVYLTDSFAAQLKREKSSVWTEEAPLQHISGRAPREIVVN